MFELASNQLLLQIGNGQSCSHSFLRELNWNIVYPKHVSQHHALAQLAKQRAFLHEGQAHMHW